MAVSSKSKILNLSYLTENGGTKLLRKLFVYKVKQLMPQNENSESWTADAFLEKNKKKIESLKLNIKSSQILFPVKGRHTQLERWDLTLFINMLTSTCELCVDLKTRLLQLKKMRNKLAHFGDSVFSDAQYTYNLEKLKVIFETFLKELNDNAMENTIQEMFETLEKGEISDEELRNALQELIHSCEEIKESEERTRHTITQEHNLTKRHFSKENQETKDIINKGHTELMSELIRLREEMAKKGAVSNDITVPAKIKPVNCDTETEENMSLELVNLFTEAIKNNVDHSKFPEDDTGKRAKIFKVYSDLKENGYQIVKAEKGCILLRFKFPSVSKMLSFYIDYIEGNLDTNLDDLKKAAQADGNFKDSFFEMYLYEDDLRKILHNIERILEKKEGMSRFVTEPIDDDGKEQRIISGTLDSCRSGSGFPSVLLKVKASKDFEQDDFKQNIQWASEQLTELFDSTLQASIVKNQDLPDELDDDPETRQLYEKAIKHGVETDKTIRIMIIGCFGQGKTTLVQRLKGESVYNIVSTDGIVVHRCICKNQNSPWINDDERTEDDVSKRIASLALSASNKESNRQLNYVSTLDPNNEQQHETNMSTDKKSDTRRLQFSEVYKKFGKAYKQLKKEKGDGSSEKKISLWDFGGQYIYYATHHLFHSAHAIYLLVFNLSLPLHKETNEEDYPGISNCKTMKDYIIFWMHSIHSFVGRSDGKEPVVILVGTHRDKLQTDEQAERYFETVRELFDFSQLRFHIYPKHFAVSLANNAYNNVDDLRAAIIELAERNESKRVIPVNWILLESELNKHAKKNIISFQDLVNIDQAIDCPLQDENQIKLFLKFHHSRGTYFYFDEAEMANHVVVNPQFVIDAFRSIIKAKRFFQKEHQDRVLLWKKLSDEAILEPELFRKVWRDRESEAFSEHEQLLICIFKKHQIIAEVMKYEDKKDKESLNPQGYYIVPSLLKRADDGKIKDFLNGKTRSTVSVVYSFYFIGIVRTILQRMLAAAIGTWPVLSYIDCLMVFENGGVFELDLDHAGLLVLDNDNIELCVVNLCPENSVAVGMGDYFRRFVEVVIQYELSKLNRNDVEIQYATSFDVKIRCHHKDHMNEGSRNMLSLEKIQEHEGEIIRCPDSKSHCLNKTDVKRDWFQSTRKVDQFPARRLNNKEYSKLARAIGYEWETLGLLLGVSPIKIQQVCMNNHSTSMRIYEMLLQWDRECAETATFDVLVKELQKLPNDSVNWEEVYNLKDNFYKLR